MASIPSLSPAQRRPFNHSGDSVRACTGLPSRQHSTEQLLVRCLAAGPQSASVENFRFGGRPALRHRGARLGLGPECCGFYRGTFNRRNRNWHFHRRCANVHCGDRTAKVARAAWRNVPVQHCSWYFDRFCLERSACRHRRKCMALDVGGCGISVPFLRPMLLGSPREPALAVEPQG